MAYSCTIAPGQSIVIDSQNSYTIVTLTSRSAGQHQQSSSGYPTGDWTAPPTIARTATGVVISVFTAQGTTQIQVQGNASELSDHVIDLANAESLPLQQVQPSSPVSMPSMQPMQPVPSMTPMPSITPMPSMTPQPMQPMQPVQPVQPVQQPMTMGNMSMQMNPMEMKMGNMELRMPPLGSNESSNASPNPTSEAPASPKAPASPNFCSQCGAAVQVGDRFCSQCGHRLSP